MGRSRERRQERAEQRSRPKVSRYQEKIMKRVQRELPPQTPHPARIQAPIGVIEPRATLVPEAAPLGGILDRQTWQKGYVKFFNKEKNFGFIRVNGVEYYINMVALGASQISPESLWDGREVRVRLRPDGRKGPEVQSVKLVEASEDRG